MRIKIDQSNPKDVALAYFNTLTHSNLKIKVSTNPKECELALGYTYRHELQGTKAVVVDFGTLADVDHFPTSYTYNGRRHVITKPEELIVLLEGTTIIHGYHLIQARKCRTPWFLLFMQGLLQGDEP